MKADKEEEKYNYPFCQKLFKKKDKVEQHILSHFVVSIYFQEINTSFNILVLNKTKRLMILYNKTNSLVI